MPDESDFKDFTSIEEYGQTVEGSKYFHSLYLKAVNHPIRKTILQIVNKFNLISSSQLIVELKHSVIDIEEASLNYHIDFLVKALCIEPISENSQEYKITQTGKIIEYLK